MATINSYKDLIVWQKSITLVKLIYGLTGKFPTNEQFGIIIQLRRAAISIPSNIAEGYGRKTRKERDHFYVIAYGSALEIETQLHISKELNFGSKDKYEKVEALLIEVIKMLNKLTASTRE